MLQSHAAVAGAKHFWQTRCMVVPTLRKPRATAAFADHLASEAKVGAGQSVEACVYTLSLYLGERRGTVESETTGR
jgi:hypothetical protein